jgi:hypothetical protein
MFLRITQRRKYGKEHLSWSMVENHRTASKKATNANSGAVSYRL